MKFWMFAILLACSVAVARSQESEDESETPKPKDSWWTGFKNRVKTVLSKWKDDIKLLWDDVLTKADDMRGWTSEVFDTFKRKMREWVDSRPDSELPDDEKNEIETFISKLKIPTEKPTAKPTKIDP